MSGNSEVLQSRAKRQKYTPNACNECRRRKAKCDGKSTCERCKGFKVECVYPNISDDARVRHQESESLLQLHTKIDLLQTQVGILLRTVHASSADPDANPVPSRSPLLREAGVSRPIGSDTPSPKEPGRAPAYVGPTSFAFGLDLPEAHLQPAYSKKDFSDLESSENQANPFNLSKEHGFRMIELFEETVGDVYPCVDFDAIRLHASSLFDKHPEEVHRRLYRAASPSHTFDRDFEILRAILANGLVLDGDGESEPGAVLMDRVETVMYNRIKVFEVDTKELLLLLLMSLYHFHLGEEIMAYRHCGIAARGVLEMGLHRRTTWARTSGNFPGDLQRTWAIKLFWCIYCLDRRWSLGTGLPFAIQDADIDVELPEVDETTPYLRCMVEYSRLTSKVWRTVMDTENGTRKENEDSTSYLDYQVQQWLNLIPTDLRLSGTLRSQVACLGETRLMLRVLLHFRASQLRIILRKPDLLSRERIAQNMGAVQVVVDLARDMVERLDSLHRTTGIYKKHRTAFDSFLVSAVAVFCLVTCYAPENFYSKVQHEFCIALEVVKGFVATSISARRLWKTIRQIRRVSPHLAFTSKTSSHGSEASLEPSVTANAANDHIGTEENLTHPATGKVVARNDPIGSLDQLDIWPEDAFQVSRELDHLFEAFNQPQVVPTSYEDSISEDRSGSGQSSPGNNLAMSSSPDDPEEIFRLFTELF